MDGVTVSAAVFSTNRLYRLHPAAQLGRHQVTRLVWVMLNPSTADASTDDATIRRVLRFSDDWDYGSVRVVNLFAYRSTQPRLLWTLDDPIGPMNDEHIQREVRR